MVSCFVVSIRVLSVIEILGSIRAQLNKNWDGVITFEKLPRKEIYYNVNGMSVDKSSNVADWEEQHPYFN